jgi:adenylate cyclase
MGTDEVGTLKGLTERRAILDRFIGEHRGRIANTAGDSVLAEFGSAVDAVQCAVDAQSALAEANSGLAPDRRINFRIGIHIGDVMVRAGDLFGDGVNIAARLQSIAKPGGVCISSATYDQVRKVLPTAFADLGVQHVKNIQDPLRAYHALPCVETKGPALTLPAETANLSQTPDKPSIAVLPFQNMSGDPEQEYFADGIVEEIITALSRFRSLLVIARNTSFTYKGKAVDIKQVGRELGVRYVLEGSVRKSADRVRITGQLIEATTGTHIWAERFEGPLRDIFDLQDRMTENVVGAIAPALEQAEIKRIRTKPTEHLDAYDYYLRATALIYRSNDRDNDEALRLLYKAIDIDPEFASAYALAAYCYFLRKFNIRIENPDHEFAEARRLADRALELGKDDAFVLCWVGFSLGALFGDLDEAAALLDRSLELNPNAARTWNLSGWARVALGEPEFAIEHLARAMRLSPLDPGFHLMQSATAFAHFFAGRYDDASLWAERALRRQPELGALGVLAASCALAGNLDKAHRAIAQILKIDPRRRLSTLGERTAFRPDLLAKFVEALRTAGMPE